MGRYIDEILQPGEKVLYSTNAHWMFYLPAIGAWAVALVLVILSRGTTTESIALVCLAAAAVQYASTERLEPGEVVAVCGAMGSGRTALLSSLFGCARAGFSGGRRRSCRRSGSRH